MDKKGYNNLNLTLAVRSPDVAVSQVGWLCNPPMVSFSSDELSTSETDMPWFQKRTRDKVRTRLKNTVTWQVCMLFDRINRTQIVALVPFTLIILI